MARAILATVMTLILAALTAVFVSFVWFCTEVVGGYAGLGLVFSFLGLVVWATAYAMTKDYRSLG